MPCSITRSVCMFHTAIPPHRHLVDEHSTYTIQHHDHYDGIPDWTVLCMEYDTTLSGHPIIGIHSASQEYDSRSTRATTRRFAICMMSSRGVRSLAVRSAAPLYSTGPCPRDWHPIFGDEHVPPFRYATASLNNLSLWSTTCLDNTWRHIHCR